MELLRKFPDIEAKWRRIQELGLATVYKENEVVRLWLEMFKSLAFVPMNLLETAFQYLIFSKHLFPQSDKLDSFLDYFRATWFDRFKPNHWNHYETIDPRSNNH